MDPCGGNNMEKKKESEQLGAHDNIEKEKLEDDKEREQEEQRRMLTDKKERLIQILAEGQRLVLEIEDDKGSTEKIRQLRRFKKIEELLNGLKETIKKEFFWKYSMPVVAVIGAAWLFSCAFRDGAESIGRGFRDGAESIGRGVESIGRGLDSIGRGVDNHGRFVYEASTSWSKILERGARLSFLTKDN